MSIQPGDLQGLRIMELGKLTAVPMTATAAFNVFNNGPNTCLLNYVVFRNFSAYANGQLLPSAFGYSWGLNSTTAPNDMRTSATFGSPQPAPVAIAQNVTTSPSYIPPFAKLYFAVTATTGALGTCDVTFFGGILNR